MGAIAQRRLGLKTFYRNLSEEARRGNAFGKIDCVTIFFKTGAISRDEAAQFLLENVSERDLVEYRKVRGHDPLE